MPQRQTLTESRPLAEAGTATGGRLSVQLIDPGWGSSGYYSAAVLAEAADRRVFPAGTHMYLDHPTAQEAADRPERSVRDLAAVLTTDAVVDPATGGLVAEARVFAPFQPAIAEMADAIGVSIRATGSGAVGEAEGRRGLIIDRLDEGLSVDFVTAAGRGGRILELLESARTRVVEEAGSVAQWLESRLHLSLTTIADDMYGEGRLTREERITLSQAIGDGLTAWTSRVMADASHLFDRGLYDQPTAIAEALGITANDLAAALGAALDDTYRREGVYAWMRDHNDEWLVFELSGDKAPARGVFQQTFALDSDGTATLTGTPVEVTVRTTYVPVGDPLPAPTTQESKEDTMPELSEAEVRELREAADRVPAVEAENTALKTQLAEANARTTASPLVDAALAAAELPAACHADVREAALASVPLTDAGALDTAAFGESLKAVIDAEKTKVAAIAEAFGAGRPRGFGDTGPRTDSSDATHATEQLTEALTRLGTSPDTAKIAARGRI